jgi:hypothetical protein
MLKGMSLHGKHLPTTLFTSYFSFILTIDLIEGCAPTRALKTKKGEVVEDIEKVSPRRDYHFPLVPDNYVVPEVIANPLVANSSLKVALFFLPTCFIE